MAFIHLHIHSEYSLVDGLVRIDELVESIAKQGSFACALTDQSNLFAMVKFYQAAIDAGIKPIIGVDAWIQNEVDLNHPHRLILLCMNEIGYKNLTKLVSQSYVEGQILGNPQIKKEWLKTCNEGLIAISNARESSIAEALLADNQELAETLVEYWSHIFKNRFYIEVVRSERIDEERYLQAAVALAEKKDCPIVASNDVRFLIPDDFEAHEARVCIHEGYVLNDSNRPKHYSEEQYLKTPQEMEDLFQDIPEALENSIEIAKRCNLELKLGQVFLPNYPVPEGYTIEQYLSSVSEEGLKKRFAHLEKIPDVYLERLNTELSVINPMGFAGYFLIVADFIRWSKENGIPVGPGRGSGAGSLVAYALDITGLDPIQNELLFERFLNPERVSMPDFDIDFCMEGRDRVIEYVANTYGRAAVSQIITFGTMAAKAVIRDVGRVLGHPYGFVDKIAKLIPLELGITLDKALESEDTLKNRYHDEEEVKVLIDLGLKLEGIVRNAGKHAGGVVIAPSQLTDFTPLYCDSNEGVLLSQFDKNDVETIGLVKFDFLGLRTLTIIDWAMKTVNEQRAETGLPPINIETLAMDDQKTFDLLRSCQTTAVFQLESRGMKDLVRRLKPDNFEEIVALVALFRPGPLQSGMVDDFINRKHGLAIPEYLHPKLTQILKPTYGIILYQEQVMQIAQVLAGYTLGSADLLRRAMGKKKPEEMAKQRAIFTEGAVERGVPEHQANHIFDLMEKFAGYGFNKSHSAAYAVLTYQTAWLKTHYPAAFMAAVLSSDMAHTDKVVIFIEECRQLKIPIIPPNILSSQYKFSVDTEGRILYGLGAIKGVGEAAISSILEARKNKIYNNLFDFCARVDSRKVSRRVIEALIRSGAMDCFNEGRIEGRAVLMDTLPDALLAAEQLSKNNEQGQNDLFAEFFAETEIAKVPNARPIEPWSDKERLTGEKETLGLYLSGHPLEQYEFELKALVSTRISEMRLDGSRRQTIGGLIVANRSLITKRGDRMAFITVEDKTGRQEVAVFSDLYQSKKELLQNDVFIIVDGEISPDDFSGGIKMRANELMDLETARSKKKLTLLIEVQAKNWDTVKTRELLKRLKPYQGGSCPVKLSYQKDEVNSLLCLGDAWKIRPKESLIENLKNWSDSIETVNFSL